MEEFDYTNLQYIQKINGNYIYLKNGGTMHCNGLNITTQEDLELEDTEIGKFLEKMKEIKK